MNFFVPASLFKHAMRLQDSLQKKNLGRNFRLGGSFVRVIETLIREEACTMQPLPHLLQSA